ncbi:50S ribosomal protein L29 [Pontibacter sp. G13]|uniref:50S ribosomal protein L29 n=1 Tax=Pontibacter sp. G13 TaxID=3074898 RepID=UPI002889ED6D|nr:50S ribosomal protein L29 [Pontibacter sp. G13]WNJ16525.1 50S ribosomal protein L29 [Pontibacter sp. G13]
MKATEIRELTTAEIEARLVEEQDAMLRMRLNHAVSAIEQPSDIKKSRKLIARLQTILQERQVAEQQNN